MSIRVNKPDVIHESFDSESVIVNLRIGVYFSLNDAGLPLWEQISKGTTEAELVAAWQKTHGVSIGEAQAVIYAFLQELSREQLIVADGIELPATPIETPSVDSPRPVLQKFTDLQDLLMLDPIHDVDERGWPHAKPAGDAERPA